VLGLNSKRVATTDPKKNKKPEIATGVQNDLPTPKCLMACRVFKLSNIRATATAATAISRTRTTAYPNQEKQFNSFGEKHCESTINIESKSEKTAHNMRMIKTNIPATYA